MCFSKRHRRVQPKNLDRGEYRLCSLNNSAQVFEKVSEEDWGRVFRTARYCTARKLPISGRLMSGEEFYINYSLNGEQYSIGLNAVGVVGTKRSYLWHQVQVCMSLARATNDPVHKERYGDLAVDFARNAGRERTSTASVKVLQRVVGHVTVQIRVIRTYLKIV